MQKSPADGYTLLMMSNTHTVNESLVPKKPFALMKDFVGISPVNYSDLLLVVHPTVPGKNVKELLALATTGSKRSAVMPDVPTVAESGVPGYEGVIWLGVMAPTGTPKAIVDGLNAEIVKVLRNPDVKKAWNEQGAEPLTMSPAEFDKYLRQDIAKWAKIVKISGASTVR